MNNDVFRTDVLGKTTEKKVDPQKIINFAVNHTQHLFFVFFKQTPPPLHTFCSSWVVSLEILKQFKTIYFGFIFNFHNHKNSLKAIKFLFQVLLPQPNLQTVTLCFRTCFPDEVQQGRQVRLIYSGRLLQDDSASISFYDVGNYSVIHGQISDARQPRQQHQGQSEEGDLDLSRLFLPLITIILCIAWLGVANYSHLFTAMSTAILTIVTGAYAFMLYAMIS